MITVGEAIGYLDLDTTGFKRNFKSALSDLEVFKNETATTSDKMTAVSSAMSGVGSILTKSVTLPLVGAGAIAAKFATDFDTGMRKVSTIADTSVKSIDALGDGVKKISGDLNISTDDMTEALYQTLSATNDTANALNYLEIAGKLAKGGFTDVTTAVDGATSVMNAYGLQGEEAFTKISDVMITTQNVGKTTVDDLAKSLFQVIPTAASLGVSFEEVSAGLAAITAQGTPTNVATTQMRQLFVELSKDGSAAAKTFQEMSGKTFKEFIASGGSLEEALKLMGDAAKQGGGGFEDFSEVLAKNIDVLGGDYDQALAKTYSELGITEKALSDMFGSVEAGNAALQLTGVGGEKFSAAMDAMAQSSGATDKAFGLVSEGAGEIFSGMINDLKILAAEMGEFLLPALKAIAEWISKGIKNFTEMSDFGKGLVVVLAAIAASIGPILLLLSGFVKVVNLVKAAKAAWLSVQLALNVAMSANPLGVIILAIVAIVAVIAAIVIAIKNLWETNEGFRNGVIAIWESIKTFFSAIGQFFVELWNGIIAFFTETIPAWINSIGAWFSKLPEMIGNTLAPVGQFFVELWDGIVAFFLETIPAWINSIGAWFGKIGENIKTGVGNVGQFFVELWNGIVAFFLETIPAWINSIGVWFGKIGENIKTGVGNVGQFFVELWNGIIAFFTETIPVWINSVVQWFDELPRSIGIMVGTMIGNIANFGESMVNWVRVELPLIIQGIVTWFSELPEKIVAFFTQIIDNIATWGFEMIAKAAEIGTNFINTIMTFFRELPGKIVAFFTQIITDVSAWGFEMITKAAEIGTNFVNGIVHFFTELPGKIFEILTNAFNAIVKFYNDMNTSVREAVVNAFNTVVTWGQDLVNKAIEIGSNFINTIMTFFRELPGKISEQFLTILNAMVEWRNNVVRKAEEIGQGFLNGIIQFVMQIKTNIEDAFNNAISFLQGLPDTLYTIGKGIIEGLWSGMLFVWDQIVGWFENVKKKIGEFFGGVKEGIDNTRKETDKAVFSVAERAVDGSHANGLDYVPYDGYVARLHRGESVRTAQETREDQNLSMNKFPDIVKVESTIILNEREVGKAMTPIVSKDLTNVSRGDSKKWRL